MNMKTTKFFKLVLPVALLVLLGACNSRGNNNEAISSQITTEDADRIKVGGLYTFYYDSSYMVSKILVSDDYAVHIRTYSNKFIAEPTDLSSDTLHIMIGHAPMDPQGFLADHPKLIKVEKVNESELEGYKMYLDAMKK